MTDSLYPSNESQELRNSTKEGEFCEKTTEEILANLDNSIVEKANRLMGIKECKENYKKKIRILDNPKEPIRQIRNKKIIPPLEINDPSTITFLEKGENVESVINKAIIMKRIPKLLYFYRNREEGKKIDEDRIQANMNEIWNNLSSKNLKNNQLANIGKILRGTRFNFNGIILEEGESGETIVKNGDIYEVTKEENPKNIILKKGDKVLVRHLEGSNVSPENMRKAMKDGIEFFETKFHDEYFNDEESKIRYVMSGSRLWNKEFRKFYKENVMIEKKDNEKKENNIQKTLERMEKINTIFVKQKENEKARSEDNNDRFMRIPLRHPTENNEFLSSKKNEETNLSPIEAKLIEIEEWLKTKNIDGKKITKENITPDKVEELVNDREQDKPNDKVKINGMIIARILRGKPIDSGICLLPIENIKKAE